MAYLWARGQRAMILAYDVILAKIMKKKNLHLCSKTKLSKTITFKTFISKTYFWYSEQSVLGVSDNWGVVIYVNQINIQHYTCL